MRSRILVLLALLLLPAPLLAQEAAESPRSDAKEIRLVGAAWCPVLSRGADEAPGGGTESPDLDPGCDAGVGVSLGSAGAFDEKLRRLHLVVAVGTQTLAIGPAWVVGKLKGRPIAVAAGVSAPWDSRGVYTEGLSVSVGATFSFGGPVQ